jgi:uncharacterized membrane protein (UPF0127 family)
LAGLAEGLVPLDLATVFARPGARDIDAMATVRATTILRADEVPVCERCVVAATPLARLKGLLGRSGLRSGEGLLIRPTSAIHTCFMRFPIDAVFLDRDLVVVKVVGDLRPWRMAARRGAKSVLELAAGESGRRGIRAGQRLRLSDPVSAG